MFTRRAMLTVTAATALVLPKLGLAGAPTDRRCVVVLLRGGLDGLAAVPPHGDDRYREVRGSLALPAPGRPDGVLDLDGRFGLHPALGPLLPLWEREELAVVHAVGAPYRDRSHFDAQDCLETGLSEPHAAGSGWLNRALGGLSDQPPAMAVGRTVPLVLRGTAPVTSADPLRRWVPEDDFLGAVARLYRADPELGPALDAAVATQALLERHRPRRSGGGSTRDLARTTAILGGVLAAPDGPRIAVLDTDGWDTHTNQEGRLARGLGDLAEGLVSLRDALGEAWSSTVVLTLTEFGRTVRPNGTGGTDHGTGTVALLAGGAVVGRRVVGPWPGLDALHQGRDLAVGTDIRAVLKGILGDHLGLSRRALDAEVFPDPAPLDPTEGLVRA